MSRETRRNPPAFDKFLTKYQEQLTKVVPPEWLPEPIYIASEAAEGHVRGMGCQRSGAHN